MSGRHLEAAWLENSYLNVVAFCDAGGCFLGEQRAGGCGVDENG